MYRLGELIVSAFQIRERLKQEKRRTSACPFCGGRKIEPICIGQSFAMECQGCGAMGPAKSDHHDPGAPLNNTSWTVALKRCHDAWNSRYSKES